MVYQGGTVTEQVFVSLVTQSPDQMYDTPSKHSFPWLLRSQYFLLRSTGILVLYSENSFWFSRYQSGTFCGVFIREYIQSPPINKDKDKLISICKALCRVLSFILFCFITTRHEYEISTQTKSLHERA